MRVRRFHFLLLLAPLRFACGQVAANPVSDSFRGFSYYGSWLLSAFDSIPASKYDYKPTAGQQTVGFIAQHLEDASYQLCARIGDAPRPVLANAATPSTIRATWPKDTLVTRLRASFLFCRDAITIARSPATCVSSAWSLRRPNHGRLGESASSRSRLL
jgi:hypothetical protein